MTRRIPLLGWLALVAGVALSTGWAWRMQRAADAERARWSAARERRLELQRRLETAEASRVFLSEEQNSLETQLTRLRAESQTSTRTPPPSSATPALITPDRAAAIFQDPALEPLRLASQRAGIRLRYAVFFQIHPLAPSQIRNLEDLVVERDRQVSDLDELTRSRSAGVDDPAVSRLRKKIDDDFQRGLSGQLGTSLAIEFTEFERTLPVRDVVDKLAGALALQGDPLTPAQATQLTSTLAEASPKYQEGGAADPNDVDWPVALNASSQVLTPPQQTAFMNIAPQYPVPQSLPIDVVGSPGPKPAFPSD